MNELNELRDQAYENSFDSREDKGGSMTPRFKEPSVTLVFESFLLISIKIFLGQVRTAGWTFHRYPSISIWHRRVISNRRAKLQGEWSSTVKAIPL
ncbi:hypothetical protein Tco_1377037 [Tanacetum coccineum]